MRRAQISTTMKVYGNALMDSIISAKLTVG